MENLTQRDPSDRRLLVRIGARDRGAICELHGTYHESISSFLAAMTQRPDLADEIVTDTFMEVWETARSFDGEARVSIWILGIAYQRGLTSEGNQNRAGVEKEAVLQNPARMDTDNGHTEVIDVRIALQRLPIEQRAALQLCYRFRLSCEEIAMVMGCTISAAKARMLDSRRKLCSALSTLDRSLPAPMWHAQPARWMTGDSVHVDGGSQR